MPNIRQVTPFVFTHDLEASCSFFAAVGIDPVFVLDDPGYAYCTDGRASVRLLELEREKAIAEQLIYFDVEDVDALYEELRPFLDTLPEGRVRGPVDQTYGQREFHVKDPDNCLLMFGRQIQHA